MNTEIEKREVISQVTNEDCMELMSRYPDKYFELAIVDPPYGNADAIGLIDNKKRNKQATKRGKYKIFDNIEPNNQYYIELERVSKNQIIWGGNYLGLCGGVIVWQKNGTAFGEAEVAICSTHKSVRIFEFTWNGMIQENMKDKEQRIHPTQKPVKLYEWLLKNYANEGDKILDTHLGSGSSRIAADKMGFDFYACELDQDYFEAQEKRFKEYKSQLILF
jgi:site-specific DNA-methyltransferase (adenine-specific)